MTQRDGIDGRGWQPCWVAVVVCMGLVLGASRAGGGVRGVLETPGPNSFQSGIGVIAGWVCAAELVTLEINGAAQPAAYGTERLDTEAACGDTANGFGVLFNWNQLGDGEHEVVAFVDGEELGRATVTVTTLGEEFVEDVEGECEVADFPSPGERVRLVWQEAKQAFVLTDGSPPPTGSATVERTLTGFLENPGLTSYQSGIGVISGWVCEAEMVTLEVAGQPYAAAYGTERLDTEAACGDTANGFGVLFNWNRLGDGEHEVVARVDGEELGRATVRVTTVGEEFVAGVEGECEVADFPLPGETVTLAWQESVQNFVIVDYTAASTVDPAPRSSGGARRTGGRGSVSGGGRSSGGGGGPPTVPQNRSEPAGGDLVVTVPAVNEDTLDPGAVFTLSVTVRNEGDEAATATLLRYYRSPAATITPSDVEVGTDAVGALLPSSTSDQSILLTAPSTPGPYYYGACVDAVTEETATTNNCSASVRVEVSAESSLTRSPGTQVRPDLAVGVPTVDAASLEPGASFTLSATVRNDGTGDAAASRLRYYRSTDATITTLDTQVATDPVAGLSASGSASASVALTAPSTPGPYYYGACVDAVTEETATTNNCSASVRVEVSAESSLTRSPGTQVRPDLAVGVPTVDAASLEPGASFTLSATVRNDGTGDAAASRLRYYRSTDATITPSDVEVGTAAVGALLPSSTSDQSILLTAPSTPGPYYYGACVDAVTEETATTNNCSASVTITVPNNSWPGVEVFPGQVKKSFVEPGETFSVTVVMMNRGGSATPATTLRLYRSVDSTITRSDTEVDTVAMERLSSKTWTRKSFTLTAPETTGKWYYGGCVDFMPGGPDSTNGCSRATAFSAVLVAIAGASDLTVLMRGLVARVRNEGTGPSFPTRLWFYQSSDASISAADDTRLWSWGVRVVQPNTTYDRDTTFRNFSTEPGTYYYGACVAAARGETDTTNNCSNAVEVEVVIPVLDGPCD